MKELMFWLKSYRYRYLKKFKKLYGENCPFFTSPTSTQFWTSGDGFPWLSRPLSSDLNARNNTIFFIFIVFTSVACCWYLNLARDLHRNVPTFTVVINSYRPFIEWCSHQCLCRRDRPSRSNQHQRHWRISCQCCDTIQENFDSSFASIVNHQIIIGHRAVVSQKLG